MQFYDDGLDKAVARRAKKVTKIYFQRIAAAMTAAASVGLGVSAASAAGVTHTFTAPPSDWITGTWTNGAPNSTSAGDLAINSVNNTTTTTGATVTVGEILAGPTPTTGWVVSAGGTFTLDNTVSGGVTNLFGGTLAAIGSTSTGASPVGKMDFAPNIVIGNSGGIASPGLVVGVAGSGATGSMVVIRGGITGTGDLYVANGSAATVTFTGVGGSINNTGNLILGKSDANTSQSGTGALTLSAAIGSNVKDIIMRASGNMTLGSAANAINNTGNITMTAAGSAKTDFTGQVNSGTALVPSAFLNNGTSTGVVTLAGGVGANVNSITNATNTNSTSTGTLVIGVSTTGLGSLIVNSGGTTLTANLNAGKISVSAGVTGTGDLTVVNNSSVANGVTFNGGNGSTVPGTSINNTGKLTFSGTGTGVGAISIVTTGIGTNVGNILFNASGGLTFSTKDVLNTGNITLSGSGAGVVTMSSTNINNAGFILNNGTSTGTTTISGAIGSLVTGVTQDSATSTLVLSGTNTYTSQTKVNNGKLLVNGVLASGSAVTVGSTTAGLTPVLGGGIGFGSVGATIDTTRHIYTPSSTIGNIQGAVTINGTGGTGSAGHLAPGNNIAGSLTVGSLNLNAGSVIDYEFNTISNVNDFVSVTSSGGLTILGGGFNLYLEGTQTPYAINGTYNLFSYTGSLGGSIANLSVLNPAGGVTAYTFGNDTANGLITLTITPEPTTAGLIGLAAMGLLARRRRTLA